ncbi:hypothetical protein ACVWZV_006071 [Bradyrhizobium sp. GM5.1]
MGQKLRAVALGDLRELPLGRDVDVAAHGARPDRREGGALDRLDLGQTVLQLGIGIAEHGHAREVADIAVIIAAGIERQHVTLLPALRRGRPVVAVAAGEQAVFEGQPAIGFGEPQGVRQLLLGRARPVPGDHRQHRGDHQFGRRLELRKLVRRLHRPQPLQHQQRVLELGAGQGVTERPARIHRQERHLDPDPLQGHAGIADQAYGPRNRIDRAVGLGPHLRHPWRRHGALMGFQTVADINRLVGCALGIDQHRQIAADAERIHVVEEDRALGTQQVLHIVLGGRDQDVEAGSLHQAVELGGVEWNGARAVCAGDVLLHDEPPNAAVATTAASVCPGICWHKFDPKEGFWVAAE